jgi:uncharacterized RDD family membrane protein YckC
LRCDGDASVTSSSFDRTAEPVPDPASWPALFEGVLFRRVVAYGVDLLCIAVICAFAWVGCLVLTVLSFGLLAPLVWLLFGLIPVAYHSLQLGGPHAATLGMRRFDLELRALDGDRPEFLQALLQTLLFYATIAATCSLILLFALVNRRRRTLHDVLSGTIVVRGGELGEAR